MTSGLSDLQGAERRTAQETVVETLRQAILGGVLPGGTRLVQAELAAQLNVSNTPVREAMRELAVEGLIRFDSYRGAVVHTPTLEEVLEVYEVRLLLEPVAMRKAVARITPAELERAAQVQEAMRRTEDVGTWVLLNRQFHGALIAAGGSPRLASIIHGLENAATPQVALSIKADHRRLTDGNQEHRRILDAVRDSDADLAAELVVEHLNSTVRAVRSFAGGAGGAADAPAGR